MKRSVAFAILAGIAVRTLASPWYVAPSGDDGNDGTTWGEAKLTIQAGVDAASGADAVVYVTNATYILTSHVNLDKAVTLVSWNNGNMDRDGTVLDGQGANISGIKVNHADAVARGFTLKDFGQDVWWAGVYLDEGLVSDCLVTNCYQGAFFYTDGAAAVLSNSTVTASTGRGIHIYYGPATVVDCTISNNNLYGIDLRAVEALIWRTVVSDNLEHGIRSTMTGATLLTVRESDIVRNSATQHGAGLRLTGANGTYVLDRCRILHNFYAEGATVWGGGMQFGNTDATMELRNTLIAHNQGTARAGGIYLVSGTIDMANCTVVSNFVNASSTIAGGIRYDAAVSGSMVNTIVYRNINTIQERNWTADSSSPLSFTNICTPASETLYNEAPDTRITADPGFLDPDNEDFRLAFGSPCINAGVYQAWMDGALDLEGKPRIIMGDVDVGCYEFLPRGTLFMVR